MRTEIDLDAAAAAGIIGEDQAIALRSFQAQRDGMTGATSEKFQLFGGYADLVIGIGMAMIVGATAIVVGEFLSPNNLPSTALGLTIAVGMSAALFALTKRINLRASPAMALVLTAGFAGFSLFSILLFPAAILNELGTSPRHGEPILVMIAIPLHAFVMRAHWRRFRFPPTFALLIAGYSFFALALLDNGVGGGDRVVIAGCALVIATATMIAGIWWDLTDIRRETERSQVAFWLHCCAGVLMSRALFSLLTGSTMVDGDLILTGLSLSEFPYVVIMIIGAAVISLLLDRRSLLVGCLLPTVGIFSNLENDTMAVVAGLMLVGTSLIFFSATWTRLRTRLLALLPDRVAAQLPRTSLIAQGQRPTRQHKELWRLR